MLKAVLQLDVDILVSDSVYHGIIDACINIEKGKFINQIYCSHSWTRITLPIPVSALASHTRFRWRQLSAIGHSGWAIDNLYIGYCAEGCNGHGYCSNTGCR